MARRIGKITLGFTLPDLDPVGCPHCENPYLAEFERVQGWCSECGSNIELNSIDKITCVCGSSVTFGESHCFHCNLEYPNLYWVTLERVYYQRMSELTPSMTDPNICCGLLQEYCKCEEPIPWNIVFDPDIMPLDIDDRAYDTSSDCGTCINNFSSRCDAYVSWVKDYIQTGKIPYEIDGCNKYLHY